MLRILLCSRDYESHESLGAVKNSNMNSRCSNIHIRTSAGGSDRSAEVTEVGQTTSKYLGSLVAASFERTLPIKIFKIFESTFAARASNIDKHMRACDLRR